MDRNYKGLIWTNHAMDRMRERGIKQGDAWATWSSPQQSKKGSAPGSWVYYKTYGGETIEVVAKQNEKKEWIILSVWSKPAASLTSKNYSFLMFVKSLIKFLRF